MNERFRLPKAAADKKQSLSASKQSAARYASMLMELEQRIAFDAAGVATVEKANEKAPTPEVDAQHEGAADKSSAKDHSALVEALNKTDVAKTEAPKAAEPVQVVFIDSSVTDYKDLLKDIKGDYKTVILNSSTDGVEQMAQVLKGMDNVSAVHILSHGNQGVLNLGMGTLTEQTMSGRYSDELQSIRGSLTDDADILIYGCNFAEGESGARAATLMSNLTGADVAASTDITGSSRHGGDWTLEYRAGVIDTDALRADNWDHMLAQTTINPGGGILADGSDGLKIYVTNLGQFQVTYQGKNQFYSNTITDTSVNLFNGMYMSVGNRVIGPDTGAENMTKVAWVSGGAQTLSGTGTAADPYVVATRLYYDANSNGVYNAATDVQVIVTTSYIAGTKYFTNNVTVTPPTSNNLAIKFYHAADTYLGGSDAGPAYALAPGIGSTTSTSADLQVIGVRRDAGTASEVFVGFAEVDGGRQFDRFYSGLYNGTGLYGGIANGGDITNTITTAANTDNGLGVQFNLGSGNTPTSFSYRLVFDSDTTLDLDANNSTAAGNNYVTSYGVGSNTPVNVVDSDIAITNVVADISRATVTLTNLQAGDTLSLLGVLPAGITASVAGNVVTLTGSASEASYQAALRQIVFNTSSSVLTNRSLTVSVFNEISSEATSANTTINVSRAPIVDLNSGTNPSQIITNGAAPGGGGWAAGGATGGVINGGYAWSGDSATGTLRQNGITGWDVGSAPSGAAQLTFDLAWNNGIPDNGAAATLEVSIGGVVYARITTGTIVGTPNVATVTFLNGASGSPSLIGSSAAGAWTPASITLNLPSTVAATGDLIFSYAAGTGGRDDIFIDNVSVFTQVDATAGNNFTNSYTENGVGVSIADTDNTVRDVDSTTMASATIVLTNAFAGDMLNIGSLPAGITGSIDTSIAGQITLTLSGTASKADYAAAIRAITFSSSSENPSTTNRVINVTVNDGALNSAVSTTTITVAAVNDAPVNTLPVAGWTTNEDTSFVLNGLSVTDPDATGIISVSLTVGSGTLTAVNGTGVTISGSGTGTLILSGTLANINAYLNSASAPTYVPVDNANGPVSLTMVTNDGGSSGTGGPLSDTDVRTITIVPVNDAPMVDLNGNPPVNVPVSGGGTFSQPSVDAGTERTNSVTFTLDNGQLVDQTRAVVSLTTIDDAFRIIVNGRAISGGIIGVDASNPAGTRLAFGDGSTVGTGWIANVNGLPRVEVRITETGIEFWGTRSTTSTVLEQLFFPAALSLPNFVAGTNTITIANADGNGAESMSGVVSVTTQSADFSTSYTEQGAGIAIVDNDTIIIDIDSANMSSATIVITNGQPGDLLAINGALPAGITANWNAATFTMTLTGSASKAAYETALEQIRYSSSSDNPTAGGSEPSRTLTVVANDGQLDSNVATTTIAITAVNDAPVNTLPGSYSGNEDTNIPLTGISISDGDANGGTITVTLNVGSGTLNAAAGGSVTVGGSGTGTLTLTGTLANINAYLAATSPTFTPGADFNGPVTLTMTTNDGGNTGTGGPLTDVDTRTITVVPVNDAPVLDLDASGAGTGYSTSYTENGTGVAIVDTDSSITDIDNANIASASIVIANGQAGDILAISGALPAGITATWNPATFTLTLSGSASKAAYETALEQVRYSSSSDNPSTTPRSINISVNDGAANSNVAVSTVNVVAVNDAPVNGIPGGGYTVNEDTPLPLTGLSVTDPDANGGTMTITLSVGSGTLSAANNAGVTVGGNGTGTLTLTGTLANINAYLASASAPSYTPVADFNGSVTLTMTSSDGALSDTDTATITINPVADIANDTATTNEDTATIINVNGNDSFENAGHQITAINGLPIAVGGTVAVSNGTVLLNANGTLTFTPNANVNGSASFTYTVTSGGTTETATVDVAITAVNDAPVNSVPSTQTTNEDTAVVFAPSSGNALTVTDVDGGVLTVTISVTNGTFSLAGIAGLTFTAGDGTADGTMTFSGTAAAINAALTGAAYVPTADYNGSAQLSIQTSDGALADSDTVDINIVAVADIADDNATTDEDVAVNIPVLANDSFENSGRAITAINGIAIIAGGPAINVSNGQVQLNANGTLTFTPTTDFNGQTSFTYTVTSGGRTETATVNVDVASINTPPTNTLPAGYTTLEDNPLGLTGLQISDADAGTGSVSVTLSVNAGTLSALAGSNVSVSGSGTGTLILTGTLADINAYLSAASRPTFSPAANASGTVTLTMTTNDNGNTGGPALIDVDTSTITITPVNDAPSGVDQTVTVNEDTTFTFTPANFGFTDPNDNPGNTLAAVVITTIPLNGTLALNGTAVTAGQVILASDIANLTWTPAANANGTGLASFTFQVRDNGGNANGGQNTDATPNTFTFNVTAVNDAPVNTLPGAFVTNEDTTLGLTGLRVSDIDSASGVLTVTLTVDSGNLSAIGASGVTVSGSGTGTIVLTGTLADLNTYLASASRPSFNPDVNFHGDVQLTMVTTDNGNTGTGGALTDTDASTITVNSVNDAPVAGNDSFTTNEDTPTTFDVRTNDTDVDGNPLTVTQINGTAISVGSPVTVTGGVVSLNANGTLTFTPNANFNGSPTFTYTVSDGQGGTDTATVSGTVTPVNDAPVAGNDSFTTNEDTATTFDVRTNDTDVDGNPLTVTQINGTAISVGSPVTVPGGIVSLNANGTLTFTPNADFNGSPTFNYTVSDGQGGTDTATVSGTVTPVNDAPVAGDDSFTTNEDTPTTFDVRTNDTDVDGNPLTVTQINGTTISVGSPVTVPGGVVSLNANGTLTFTPNANFNGSPTFDYTVSDGQGGTDTATVSGTVVSVQDVPVANPDSFTTNEDVPAIIDVLGNDTDADGDPLTITEINGTAIVVGGTVNVTGGMVTLNNDGTLTFTPNPNFNGTPTFEYTVSDGQGNEDTGTVSGTVVPVNDAPVATNDTFSTNEDAPVTFDVRTNDTDVDGNPLTVTQINGTAIAVGGSVPVTGGTVTLGADGRLTFQPAANFNGSPSFSYTVSDGQGGTATAVVSGTVLPVNDNPVAGPDNFTTNEDTSIDFDVRGNDTDVDGDPLTVTQINGTAISPGGSVNVTNGVVTLHADGKLTFTPNANYNGSIAFNYTVSDGNGGTALGSVSGTVVAVNDLPVSSDTTVTITEDNPITGNLPTATDADNDPVTYSLGTTSPAHGNVTINPNGSYTYTPDANFNGSDTFTFVVSDGKGGTNEYTVTVNVTPENDAPTVVTPLPGRTVSDGANVNLNVAGAFTDVDGDTLTFTQTGLPSGLSISASGVISGTVDRSASQGGPNNDGVYIVTINVSDGNGGTVSQTFTYTVTNPAPTAVNDTATTNEDVPVTINVINGSASGGVADSDPDGDPLTVISASAGNGTVVIGANGQITYRPAANFNGTDTIVYTISDGNGGTSTATVTVTVNPVNDAPTPGTIADRTRNDGDADSLNASAFFTDPDGDTLTYSVTGLPQGLTINPTTGVISGTISPSASGPTGERVYTVTITASDGKGGTTPITFDYTIINLPPVAGNDTATTAEDTPVQIDILANDTDPDGDAGSVIRVNNVVLTVGGATVDTANGTVQLVLNAAGRQVLLFTPNTNYNGQESFTYTIDDGNGGVDTATVTVTVTADNDTPVVTNPIPDIVRADGQTFNYDASDFFDDPDGDGLNFVVTGLPAGLTIDPLTGIISGTIDKGASNAAPGGVYQVTITAYDRAGGTGLSVSQTFDLTVTNPAPTAKNDTVSVNEDTTASFNVITGAGTTSGAAGADIDPDGDTLSVVSASAGNGTVAIGANGQLTYTPRANYFGTDTITYTISDGNGGTSTATVRITVNPVNDAPTADPIQDLVDSDSQIIDQDFSSYFHDIDNSSLTFTASGLPAGLSIDADGNVTGQLANNASTGGPNGNGTYSVTITATDAGGLLVSRTFTWFASNIPPTGFDDVLNINEGTASGTGNVLANDRDPDGDGFAVSEVNGSTISVGTAVAGSNGGTFTINADGSYSFVAGPSFDNLKAGETRTTTVTYKVLDDDGGFDTATLTVIVTGVNSAPTADPIPTYTRADGDALTGSNAINVGAFFKDVEGDTLTFTVAPGSLPAGLTMDAAGNITGTIARNASVNGPYVVTVTANDGHGGTVSQTFSFNVTNPAPTAVNDAAGTLEDTPVDINVVGNDTDPDGDTLFVDPNFPPEAGNGTVTINPDGTLHYVPNADFSGVDTIVYRVSDGQGGFSTGIVEVTVREVNDPPVAIAIPDSERNDGDTISLDLSGHFSDPEGGPLTIVVSGLPAGLRYDAATNTIVGRIAPGASGPNGLANYPITITATDDLGLSVTTEFTFTIRNLAPNAENDTATTLEDTPVNIPILDNDSDPDNDPNEVIRINGVNLVVNGPFVSTTNGTVQLILENGKQVIRFTPNANFVGIESFDYSVHDGNGGTDTATVTISVGPVNDAPVATTIPPANGQDGSPVNLNVSGFFSDVDGDTLRFSAGNTLPPGLSIDPNTGLISGTLRADASQGGPYTVTITASDGNGGTVSTNFVFNVANPVPVAVNDTVATNEDTPVTVNVLGNDVDPDNDPLTVTQINGQPISAGGSIDVGNGTIRLNADNTLTFTPDANYNGTTVVSYRISDGNGGFADASVTFNVNSVNDVPTIDLNNSTPGTGHSANFEEGDAPVAVANGDAFVRDIENEITDFDVTLGGFVDGGSEVIHLNNNVDIVIGTPSSGTIQFGGTLIAFTYNGAGALHFENAAGADVPIPNDVLSALVQSMRYENDSDNPTDGNRTVSFTVTDADNATSAAAVSTILVGAVNDAPVAGNDTITTGENTPVIGTAPGVLANDTDQENDPLTVTLVNGAQPGTSVTGSNGGSFIINANGSYSFNPSNSFDDLKPGETRSTSVTYTVSDGNGGTDTATLTVVVTGANDVPVGTPSTIATNEDTPITGRVTATDADGDPLTFTVPQQPTNGTVVMRPDGTYTYTPDPNFNGTETFNVRVDDGKGGVTTLTVTVTVRPVNDVPVGNPSSVVTNEDTPINGRVTATDADGDPLTFTVPQQPENGTVVMRPDGTYTFTPNPNFNGTETFNVRVDDGKGGVTTLTVTVTVRPVNDGPTGTDTTITTREDTPISGQVPANDADGDPLTFTVTDQPSNGTVVMRPDGSYTYTPNANFNGTETFNVRVDDGKGGFTIVTVTVNVSPVNDAPVGSDTEVTTDEDTPISGTLPPVTDADGDPITYGVGSQPENGTVTVNPDGTYTFTPNPGFSGEDSFTYTVSDGTTTVTYTVKLNVEPADDEPDRQLERDPPVQFPDANRTSPYDNDLDLEGEISKSIGDLGSINYGVTVDGMIDSAVNAARSLNGIGGLPYDGPIVHAVEQAGEWVEGSKRLDNLIASPLRGGSSIHLASSSEETFFVVDTVINDNMLYVLVSGRETGNNGDGKVEFRITLADGRALPNWFALTKDGVAIGQPPAGMSFIDIRINAASDGRVVEETLRIDMPTGTILNHSADRRGDIQPELFSDRLFAELSGRENDTATLATALANWSDLRDPVAR
ncbi:Ig-like domain-containing protein [Phyllobacterium sp. YR531]|uniref:Ig-like domain-containing protein n=1 Tax=Phyllobacterium sp. YR531 TaxID=1144343 RepID=UPI000273886A|nr:Ig-like domain-containing protein [Phyllobacterium sp. YR531]EJN03643.1 putative Ig domain-containing protein [Phyllobacterium sp. YR531]